MCVLFAQIISDIMVFLCMLVVLIVANWFCLLLLYPTALIPEHDNSSSTDSEDTYWPLSPDDADTVRHAVGTPTSALFASLNMVRP
jgi:hypothetical protein